MSVWGTRATRGAAWYSAVHVQATVVSQVHNVFPSPYIGKKSLLPNEPAANTMTGTVFYAARLWESERGRRPDRLQSRNRRRRRVQRHAGVAGFPNGESPGSVP